jgi:hypothetical protein
MRVTPRIAGCAPLVDMLVMAADDSIDYEMLREAVEAAISGGLTARKLSLLSSENKNPDLVRNFLRKGTKPNIESVDGIANALGLNLVHFIKDYDGVRPTKKSWLLVNADVEAGVWREQVEWGPEDWFEIQIEPSDNAIRGVFGAVVKGRSMEKVLPPGTILRCEDVIFGLSDYNDGDYAIVERVRHGLTEITCKRLSRKIDGSWELRAESYQPEFQDPIYLGNPVEPEAAKRFRIDGDEEVRVRALVIDAYLPLKKRVKRKVM